MSTQVATWPDGVFARERRSARPVRFAPGRTMKRLDALRPPEADDRSIDVNVLDPQEPDTRVPCGGCLEDRDDRPVPEVESLLPDTASLGRPRGSTTRGPAGTSSRTRHRRARYAPAAAPAVQPMDLARDPKP